MVVLILVIAGITAGATRSLGPVLAACTIFQFTCLLPLIARAQPRSSANSVAASSFTKSPPPHGTKPRRPRPSR